VIFKELIVTLLIALQVYSGTNMVELDQIMNTNPALIEMYQEALLQRESTGNYLAKHNSSVIEDYATGKPIKVQALGGYGILDINFPKWAKQAGLTDFSMEDGDWKDPKVQDAVARYKIQEYFNKYNSWDLVSIAWFAGPGKSNEFVKNGTINFQEEDANGVDIQSYVDSMNKLISEEVMDMEIPVEQYTPPQNIEAPMQSTNFTGQGNMNQLYAAQILDAMTKANAGGVRPSLMGDAARQASNVKTAIDTAKTKGESTINVSMASEKNPNSARELGMNR